MARAVADHQGFVRRHAECLERGREHPWVGFLEPVLERDHDGVEVSEDVRRLQLGSEVHVEVAHEPDADVASADLREHRRHVRVDGMAVGLPVEREEGLGELTVQTDPEVPSQHHGSTGLPRRVDAELVLVVDGKRRDPDEPRHDLLDGVLGRVAAEAFQGARVAHHRASGGVHHDPAPVEQDGPVAGTA
jgi:hypothetical protein